MAPSDKLHPHVAFAKRFGSPSNQFFNAASAIARLEDLVADARKLQSIFDKTEPEEGRWSHWWPREASEIVSYYAVGYATCLEWHARSRIVDLFGYKPGALKPSDVQGRIGEKIVPQMVSNNTTVAQLIGASINVGTFSAYMSLIARIFEELDIDSDPYKALIEPASGTPLLSEADFERLETLFNFRNSLVHEIGIDRIGHPNIRSAWRADIAIEAGNLSLSVLKGIERMLFQHAPRNFPNLVRDDGFPVQQIDVLESRILDLEAQIASRCKNHDQHDKDDFAAAVLSEKEYRGVEWSFISHSTLLHYRYIDLKTPLKVKILEHRISYLELLLDSLR